MPHSGGRPRRRRALDDGPATAHWARPARRPRTAGRRFHRPRSSPRSVRTTPEAQNDLRTMGSRRRRAGRLRPSERSNGTDEPSTAARARSKRSRARGTPRRPVARHGASFATRPVRRPCGGSGGRSTTHRPPMPGRALPRPRHQGPLGCDGLPAPPSPAPTGSPRSERKARRPGQPLPCPSSPRRWTPTKPCWRGRIAPRTTSSRSGRCEPSEASCRSMSRPALASPCAWLLLRSPRPV